jgi:hypothetical protein
MTPAPTDGSDLLTYTRRTTMHKCLKKHWFRYEEGLRPERQGAALRKGIILHRAQEWLHKHKLPIEVIVGKLRENYAEYPEWVEPEAWGKECEDVVRIFIGHTWRWREQEEQTETLACEIPFITGLVNPDGRGVSRTFRMAGKIDRIVKLPDGRIAVVEYKNTSFGISPGSDYWTMSRLDQQDCFYVRAAREMGYEVSTVIRDVVHFPQIKPRKLTKAEANAFIHKQVWFDEDFSTMASTPERETPTMYGARVRAQMGEEPDKYFQRMEFARTDADIDTFLQELWQDQTVLREARQRNWWTRNTTACIFPFRCEYLDICESHRKGAPTPERFVKLDYIHPELQEES